MDFNRNTRQFNLTPQDIEALGEPLFGTTVPETDIIKLYDRVDIRVKICADYDPTNFPAGAHRNEEQAKHARAERVLMHIMAMIEPHLSEEIIANEIDTLIASLEQ